ncbi:MAG TPA: hypothetical protein G4N94_12685 [Caldilineae bacterium]|nr:hypothetical protein [Caldilineae bacterium]
MSSKPDETELLNPTVQPAPTSLLATIRRLYFYLIATVSFLVGLNGLISLLEVLSQVWLGDVGVAVNTASYVRNAVARNGGMLLVATPIFLIHWVYIQRLRTEPAEVASGIRKFALYLLSVVTLGWGASLAGELLGGAAALLLGVPLTESEIWPSHWLFLVLGILVNGALFAYLQRQLRADGDWGREQGWAGTWRRVFQTVVGLVGLAVFISGAGVLMETLWRVILPGGPGEVGEYWARGRLSMGFAMLAIGGLLWRFNWLRWRQIIHDNPADGRTALRRFYLYASVVASAIATLVPAAVLLRQLLLLLFGVDRVADVVGGGLATPLAFLPVGLALWVWHWRVIQREAASYGDSPESALVRRIYYYVVAAIGLVLTWFGLVALLRVLLDVLSPAQASLSGQFWAEQLANGLSLLAVGAPVWAVHWRTVQSVARRPDAVGETERSSWPRRLYLYAVALAGALIILYYLTTVVYRFLLLLLGEPDIDLFGVETIDALARSAITLVFWLVHVLAIRRDGQFGAEEMAGAREMEGMQEDGGVRAAPLPEDVSVRRVELEAKIQQLELQLEAARAELARLEEPDAVITR